MFRLKCERIITYLSTYRPIYLDVYLSNDLTIDLSVCVTHSNIYLPINRSPYLSIDSVCSISSNLTYPTYLNQITYLTYPIYRSVYRSPYLSRYVSVSFNRSLHLFIRLCTSISRAILSLRVSIYAWAILRLRDLTVRNPTLNPINRPKP